MRQCIRIANPRAKRHSALPTPAELHLLRREMKFAAIKSCNRKIAAAHEFRDSSDEFPQEPIGRFEPPVSAVLAGESRGCHTALDYSGPLQQPSAIQPRNPAFPISRLCLKTPRA